MVGYWDKPDETACHHRETDGGARGTPGTSTRTAYLFLHDRIKDMVVSGGENIYPAEVENVLLAIDGVADEVVIVSWMNKRGETVKAIRGGLRRRIGRGRK